MTEAEDAILIVDDEENVLSSLRRLFRPDGYRIFTASSAAEGTAILRDNPIWLVISDNVMPGVTGVEFLRQVREEWPDTVRIMLTAYADLDSAMEAINQGRVYQFVAKPWDPEGLRLLVRQGLNQYRLARENRRMQAMIQEQNTLLKGWNESLQQAVEQRTREVQKNKAELERLYERLKGSFVDTIKVFVGLIELRSPAVVAHSRRVAMAALSLCRQMGLNEDVTKNAEIAALLHDIGKIGLAHDILNRDEKYLSARERALLRQHPVSGQAALQIIDDLEPIALLVRHHHERWDGKGYPDGLRWEEIPAGSRIIAVADAFDHHQEAKEGSSADFVEAQLRLGPNGALDPEVLLALGKVVQDPSRPEGGREIALNALELVDRMVVSRDVRTVTGMLIVPKGETLKQQSLSKLALLVRQRQVGPTVYVYSNT